MKWIRRRIEITGYRFGVSLGTQGTIMKELDKQVSIQWDRGWRGLDVMSKVDARKETRFVH